jgi:hypothetical protein
MGRGFRITLWVFFTLCLVVSGLLLLPACGLALPHQLPFLQSYRSKFCPVPIDRTAYLRASEERMAKLQRIHQAELKVAQTPRCAAPGPAGTKGTPLPQPTPRAQPRG